MKFYLLFIAKQKNTQKILQEGQKLNYSNNPQTYVWKNSWFTCNFEWICNSFEPLRSC